MVTDERVANLESVLASFIAMAISTETSIRTCVLTGAACYAVGGLMLSGKRRLAADVVEIPKAEIPARG